MKKVSLAASLIGIAMTLALVPACGKDKKAADPAPSSATPGAAAVDKAPAAAGAAAPAGSAAAPAAKKDDKGGW